MFNNVNADCLPDELLELVLRFTCVQRCSNFTSKPDDVLSILSSVSECWDALINQSFFRRRLKKDLIKARK